MAETTNKRNEPKLRQLQTALAAGIAETLRSLVNMQVVCRPGELRLTDGPALRQGLATDQAVVRAALDREFAGRTLRLLFDARDAATLACAMMLAPQEQMASKRKSGTLDAEDAQVFGEVANVLGSCLDNVLRAQLETVGARLQDHALLKPGSDPEGLVGEGRLAALGFTLQLGTFEPTAAILALDFEIAERWNGAPLVALPAPDAAGAGAAGGASGAEPAEEDIPQAPIRGRLATFVADPEAMVAVRKSCRSVGLELDRRSKTEIPNPAAHKDQIILIEIAAGEERKFDWCRRLKGYHESIQVVLLLHHASRQRVLQGFIAKADAILAHPLVERQLAAKLAALLNSSATSPK